METVHGGFEKALAGNQENDMSVGRLHYLFFFQLILSGLVRTSSY